MLTRGFAIVCCAAIMACAQDTPKIIRKDPITGIVKTDPPPASKNTQQPATTTNNTRTGKSPMPLTNGRVQRSVTTYRANPDIVPALNSHADVSSHSDMPIAPAPLAYTIRLVDILGHGRIVPPEWYFHRGDLIQIIVTPSFPGEVYVFERTTGFKPRQVFPAEALNSVPAMAEAGRQMVLPAPNRPFEFDQRAGDICVVIGIVPRPGKSGSDPYQSEPTVVAPQSSAEDNAGTDLFPKGIIVSKRLIQPFSNDQVPTRASGECSIQLHEIY